MTWIALKMLTGDRSKYFAIIFGVTFACFLIAEQSAIVLRHHAAHHQPDPRHSTAPTSGS